MIKDNEIYRMPDDFEISCILCHFSDAIKDAESYDEQRAIETEYANCMKILFKNGCGDVYTFDDFISLVDSGCYTDYDGIGYIVDENGKEIKPIECETTWLKRRKKKSHYIIWYNK